MRRAKDSAARIRIEWRTRNARWRSARNRYRIGIHHDVATAPGRVNVGVACDLTAPCKGYCPRVHQNIPGACSQRTGADEAVIYSKTRGRDTQLSDGLNV